MLKPENPPLFETNWNSRQVHPETGEVSFDPPETEITLRDLFAAAALQGILANASGSMKHLVAAMNAFDAADAMLEARNREEPTDD